MTTVDKEQTSPTEVVVIDYDDLKGTDGKSEEMLKIIERAYGLDGVGILAIRGVPGFVETKEALLSQSYPLANLPSDELKKLEDESSLYNAGWSHGKEKLKADKPDWAKASFYFNPITDLPGTEEDRKKYPISYPINRWPDSSLLPTFQSSAKELGSLMKDVAVLVARCIDSYATTKSSSYQPVLYDAMKDTEKVKGRLLYYYPLPPPNKTSQEEEDTSEDSWIGWHNDSGFLTCLAGDMYLTPDGTKLPKSPNPHAGLYVVDRQDRVVKVSIPSDCMAIQIGECAQVITGGCVSATPHCVRGAPNIARTSLACFIDTPPSYRLTSPDPSNTVVGKSSSRVPPLEKRWNDGMTFGDFLQKTFEMYYDS